MPLGQCQLVETSGRAASGDNNSMSGYLGQNLGIVIGKGVGSDEFGNGIFTSLKSVQSSQIAKLKNLTNLIQRGSE